MKNLLFCSATIAFVLFNHTIASCAEIPVLNLSGCQNESAIKNHLDELVTVRLSGKINHAGPSDYHAVVAGVHVWLAEYPSSKQLQITSDEKGWWSFNVLKRKGVHLEASFVYAKEGWITTKSNVMTIADKDDTDIAIQYIDPQLLTWENPRLCRGTGRI